MDTIKKHSILQERIVDLYLRLNGYFTSGLIIHSEDWGKQSTEIDNIAVRFPKHLQKDRKVNCSKYLEIPNNIDILICEVKSKKQELQFNKPLINPDNLEVWEKMLNWIGLFSKKQIVNLKKDLNSLVQTEENVKNKNFKFVTITTDFGKISIRPIVFSPERNVPQKNQIKYIHGNEIIDFIWKCLCPKEKRNSCSTMYDLTSWGTELYPIVKIFKDANKTNQKIKNIKDIYQHYANFKNI